MAYKQKDYVRDFIFPLITVTLDNNEIKYESLIGTGFLIGKNGYALTAAHVIDQLGLDIGKQAVACFVGDDQNWYGYKIIEYEKHPSEDVGLVKLEQPFTSCLQIHSKPEHQSLEYESWGYPLEVAKLSAKYEEHGLEQPDLIYFRGYVRRRISKPLPVSILIGENFYELSDIGGHGCSGGPIIIKRRTPEADPKWSVFGIYIGENTTDTAVGYAVRAESFENWKPKILSRDIRTESEDV